MQYVFLYFVLFCRPTVPKMESMKDKSVNKSTFKYGESWPTKTEVRVSESMTYVCVIYAMFDE